MIFVTVGTHEQPFDRLVEYMDQWSELNEEAVMIQSGFAIYEPQYCSFRRFYSYSEMTENMKKARIIVTHGGPSSFIMPLQIGKIPVVVPRKKEFEEHVNDHQVDFTHEVAKRQGNIIVVEDIQELGDILQNYDKIVQTIKKGMRSNNATFNSKFEKLVNDMVGDQK